MKSPSTMLSVCCCLIIRSIVEDALDAPEGVWLVEATIPHQTTSTSTANRIHLPAVLFFAEGAAGRGAGAGAAATAPVETGRESGAIDLPHARQNFDSSGVSLPQ